jgi:hypothetical protein
MCIHRPSPTPDAIGQPSPHPAIPKLRGMNARPKKRPTLPPKGPIYCRKAISHKQKTCSGRVTVGINRIVHAWQQQQPPGAGAKKNVMGGCLSFR